MADRSLVVVRFGADASVVGVMSRVVYALGARTGIGVERLDELGMAIEVASQARGRYDLSVVAEVVDDGLEVRLAPLSASAISPRAALLERLVDRVDVTGDEVRLGVRA